MSFRFNCTYLLFLTFSHIEVEEGRYDSAILEEMVNREEILSQGMVLIASDNLS